MPAWVEEAGRVQNTSDGLPRSSVTVTSVNWLDVFSQAPVGHGLESGQCGDFVFCSFCTSAPGDAALRIIFETRDNAVGVDNGQGLCGNERLSQ